MRIKLTVFCRLGGCYNLYHHLCSLTYLMSSSCNEIYSCPTIKKLELELEVSLGRKKREQWIYDGKKETGQKWKRWGLTCFCTIWSFFFSLLIMANSSINFHVVCTLLPTACLHLSLIFPQHDSFEALIITPSQCSEHGILSGFALELKKLLRIQTVLIFITFLSVSVILLTVFGVDPWKFVITF